MWYICFWGALVCAIVSVILALALSGIPYKKRRLLTTPRVLFAGVLVCALLLFIPLYVETMRESDCGVFEAVLLSVHNMIRLFIVDGEFAIVTDNASRIPEGLYTSYCALFAVLFVAAPLTTFGFVLSFFRNIEAWRKLWMSCAKKTYVFSSLSDRTLALAESIAARPGKRLIVFTNVYINEDEPGYELTEKARELGAVCFQKDILSVSFIRRSKKGKVYFFAMGEDASENVSQALGLIAQYGHRDNIHLYVLSDQVEAGMLLAGHMDGRIKIRRINEIQNLIYHTLDATGGEIFAHAVEAGEEKDISALVIGMGRHGSEMAKALTWFCQMEGYRIHIHCYDQDDKAATKLEAQCPELIAKSGNFEDRGEARYELQVHAGVDVCTGEFLNKIEALDRVTYVLVSLGDDSLNIQTAVRLRTLFERKGMHPMIQAIVQDTEKNAALSGVVNHAGQPYDIDCIGALGRTYSYEVIIDSRLEREALERHMKWGEEKDFWKYEYNYRSSIASVLHHHIKRKCHMPGIDKAPGERSEQEREILRVLEHRRWNAYMRSEGFVCGKERNHLAKTHPSLVTFDALHPEEQAKDDD